MIEWLGMAGATVAGGARGNSPSRCVRGEKWVRTSSVLQIVQRGGAGKGAVKAWHARGWIECGAGAGVRWLRHARCCPRWAVA